MINNILKWVACFVTLFGAIATSLAWDPLNIWLLNLGSILYMTWAIRIREPSLITINAGLLAIYLFGAFIRISNG